MLKKFLLKFWRHSILGKKGLPLPLSLHRGLEHFWAMWHSSFVSKISILLSKLDNYKQSRSINSFILTHTYSFCAHYTRLHAMTHGLLLNKVSAIFSRFITSLLQNSFCFFPVLMHDWRKLNCEFLPIAHSSSFHTIDTQVPAWKIQEIFKKFQAHLEIIALCVAFLDVSISCLHAITEESVNLGAIRDRFESNL